MFIFAYTVVFQIAYRTSATFVKHKHNTCMFWNKWKVTLINAFLKEHANIIHKNISILFKYFCWNVRSLCSLLETSFFKKTTENLQKWNLSLSLLFLMAKMLQCFLDWIIGLKKWWLMFLVKGSVLLNSSIFWVLTVLKKNLFKMFFIFRNDFICPTNKISERILSC